MIDQNGDPGAGNGALDIENTGSERRAIRVYTEQGAGQSRDLVEFRADNAAFDEEVLIIKNDGVGDSFAIEHTNNNTVVDIDKT